MHRYSEEFDNPPRRPTLLGFITIALALVIGAAKFFRIPLSDNLLAFDFALVSLVTGFLIVILGVVWVFWLWYRSRWPWFWSRLVPVLVLAVTVGGLVCFRPVFNGGMWPDRWAPRFWSSRTLVSVDRNTTVTLEDSDPWSFPGFLGATGDGQVVRFAGDLDSLIDAERLWKKSIGAGWSGFVAQSGLAWTMHQDGAFESVICLDIQTGDVCWDWRHARRHDDSLGGPGPRATPAIDAGRVYAQGANGVLVCLDATNGQLQWEQDISKLCGIPLMPGTTSGGYASQQEKFNVVWGRSGSPLVEDDLVIVPGGGPRSGTQDSLMAFDKISGDLRWRGGDQPIGYSSPVAMELDGVRQIVIVNEASVTGHDPANGETLWSFPWPGHSDSDANTSQATSAGTSRVLVSKGYGVGGALFEVRQTGNGQWSATPVWNNPRVLKTKLTNPVIRGGFAWGLSDGILECVDLETGKRLWKKGRFGHGQLLLVGANLLVHSEHGFLSVVAAATDEYRELGRVETIDGICWNYPTVYDRYVLVRSDLEAACFQLPVADGAAARRPTIRNDESGPAPDGEQPNDDSDLPSNPLSDDKDA